MWVAIGVGCPVALFGFTVWWFLREWRYPLAGERGGLPRVTVRKM